MAAREYRKLQGMALEFVSGVLEEDRLERTISYSAAFDMALDFTHFVQMANAYIPGYLNSPINAIRPELDGIGYHNSYNYLSTAAGNIGDNHALFDVFTPSSNYMNEWVGGGLEARYHKPQFNVVDGRLQVVGRKDYRWEDNREINVEDLPVIRFQWALNLMLGHTFSVDPKAPSSVVLLGYAEEDLVEVEGLQMHRGTRYMVGRTLHLGPIHKEQVLTAR
ncbi:hypothetical protein [Pseudomonas sp.]|jgi:hypothetical protein|uniref:hypothetical protein n=1 Tax=Pseudomonas sp. TaxID=306 RepID=UPI0032634950